jgi:nucleoside-diphosphate-sugar epimerase
MRVFVAGATGALGQHLVPGLVAAGHEVTATTRTPGKAGQLREAGAEPVVVDGLDREAVIAAVQPAPGRGALSRCLAESQRSGKQPETIAGGTEEPCSVRS